MNDLRGFPGGSVVKNLPANDTGDTGLIPGSGRVPEEGNGNSLQYSCLENPMTEETGGIQSMGLKIVRHDLATKRAHTNNLSPLCACGVTTYINKNTWRFTEFCSTLEE